MAAPSFVGAGVGVTIASGSGAVTAAGSGVAVGDLIILQVLQDGVTASAVTYSAISGIANLAGTASSLTVLATDQPCGTLAKQHLRVGRATSTTCSVTVATTGNDLYYRIYVFRGVDTGTALTDILENGTAGTIANGSGATAAVADTGVTTLGTDRLAVQFVGVDNDNPLGAFTGMTGGTWVEATAAFVTATGTNAAIQLQLAGVLFDQLTGAAGDIQWGFETIDGQRAAKMIPSVSGTLDLLLPQRVVGAPSDDMIVEIQTDASGLPSGTVIGTSVTLNVTGTSFVTYPAPVQATVVSGTTYWVVLRRTGAINATNNYSALWATVITRAGAGWDATAAWVARSSSPAFTALRLGTDAAGTIDGGSYTMAAADNWGVIGFALKPLPSGTAWTATPADSVTMSDSTTTEVGRTATVPDTLALADALSSAAVFARTIPDTVAIADAQTVARDIAQAIVDTLSLADATAVARDIAQAIPDTLALSDSATTAAGKGAQVDDTLALTDAVRFDQAITVADTVALSDVVAQAEEIHIADTLALTDLCDPVKGTGSVAWTQPVADTLGLADSLALDRGLTVTDTLAIADALSSQAALQRSLADTVTPADSLASQAALLRAVADTLSLADAQAFALDRALTIADTLALADAASSTATLLRTIADTLAIVDAINTTGSGAQTVADTILITDALRFDRTLNLADTVSLADQLVSQAALARTIGDTVALGDSVTANRGLTRTLADTLALADSLAFELERALAFADTVSLSDAQAFQATLVRLLEDTVAVADVLTSDSIVPTPLPPGWIDHGSRGRLVRAGSGRIDYTNHGHLGSSRPGRLARTVTHA